MIYKPKNSPHWHYDFVIKGQRYYGSTYVADKRNAERIQAEARQQATSTATKRKTITLDEAAGYYAADIAEAKPSWGSNRGMIAALLKALGPTRLLSDITQVDLRNAIAKRRNGRMNSTINRELNVWRALWNHAASLRFDIGEMPAWEKLMLPVPKQAPKSYSVEQEAALFAHLRADLHPMAEFALASGWRVAEVHALRWADIDMTARTVRSKIKGGDVIERPMTGAMLALIASQPRVCPQVFTYEAQASRAAHKAKDGRKRAARKKGERYPFSRSGWRKPWVAALKAAGIEGLTFHTLRHTRGRRMTAAGVSLQVIAEALGHRNVKTTMKYASANADDVRRGLEASEKIDTAAQLDVAIGHKRA